jgi:hypothetical protein
MKIEIGSPEWANRQLRFAIAILQGHICGSSWKGRLQLALIVKERLREYGYSWHAERVDNWIHRCQPRAQDPEFQARKELAQPIRADLSEREREEVSF